MTCSLITRLQCCYGSFIAEAFSFPHVIFPVLSAANPDDDDDDDDDEAEEKPPATQRC